MKYEEYEIEIIDSRDVRHTELLRVSSRKVLDMVLQQRIAEFSIPPKKVRIKEITEIENENK